MSVSDIQDELLHLEYPFLLPDHDPEIERYYEFRAMGRSQDALALYQNRLKVRYPNDEFRTHLMRSYRSRSSAYRKLLAEGYRSLGARSLARIKRIIDYISNEAESYNQKDVYATIKAAENILRVLPKERYEAIAGIERYHRYAEHLNYREKSLFKASELVRAYLTESLSIVEEERQRRLNFDKKSKAMERERLVKADWDNYEYQKKYGSQNSLVSLSSVDFSQEDLKRIEIPKEITSLEDKTLAYCIKYWQNTNNPAFERILFLYSRKYGTKNYDIYMTIRRGQLNKNRDDEILSSVLSVMVTGYYYSIQGDMYLQRTWNRLKNSFLQEEQTSEEPVSDAAKTKKTQTRVKAATKSKRAKNAQIKNTVKKENRKVKAAAPTAGKSPPSPQITQTQKAVNVSPVKTKINKEKVLKSTTSRNTPKKENKSNETKIEKRSTKNIGIVYGQKSIEKPTGSVSDRLQLLSGRSYDVYKERFLAKARGAIRKVLGTGKGLFFVIPEDVEDSLYNFLRDHYSDPYMNWESSEGKKQIAAKGFDIHSLNPIIDECYKRLS
jgi:hypothetical protein